MPDTEAVENTAVSFGLDIEVSDPFSSHRRRFHLDSTIRTLMIAHSANTHL
nr:hypothetical protein [Haloglomus irregulare]